MAHAARHGAARGGGSAGGGGGGGGELIERDYENVALDHDLQKKESIYPMAGEMEKLKLHRCSTPPLRVG